MAGIRLGVAYMNQQILSYYNKVKAPYNISSVNQLEALKLLTNVEETQQQIQDILVEKQKMQKELENIKTVRKVYPSDTNFFLIEVEDADQVYDQLIKQHIIVRNRNSVVKNCIRITIGTVQENQKLINALKKINNG
jgi:histidinol-phosphate aminotransferase